MIQTWYQSPGGQIVQWPFAKWGQLLQTCPIIGTFTIGESPANTVPHLILPLMGNGSKSLVLRAYGGGVNGHQAGASVDLVVTDDLRDMPVMVGANGTPGLPGAAGQQQRLRKAAVGGLLVLAIVVAAGITAQRVRPKHRPQPPDAPPTPITQVTPEPRVEAAPPTPAGRQHHVKEGETLMSISILYYHSWEHAEAIRQANHLENTTIYAGDVITIPSLQ